MLGAYLTLPTTTMSSNRIIRRLTLIKYLFNQGVEQSIKAEPVRGFSILQFHDATEMLLKLAIEHKNIKKKENGFRSYWELLPELTHKESIMDLNSRRNSLKHEGHIPGKEDILYCKMICEEFLKQSTKNIFGLAFSEISLANLISYNGTREYLVAAEKFLTDKNYIGSIEQSKKAFEELLFEYKSTKLIFGQNAFDISTGPRTSSIGRVSSTDMSVRDIISVTQILALGIDFKQYSKFMTLTPKTYREASTGHVRIQKKIDPKFNSESNAQFCLSFVVGTSLNLQDFDFELDELINPTD